MNWQPGMFAQQTASSVLVPDDSVADDVEMQIDDEVDGDGYRQDCGF